MQRRSLRALYDWLERHELGMGLAVSSLAAGVIAFLEVLDEVSEGEFARVDRAVMLAFRKPENLGDAIGPRWVEDMGRDVTALGSVAVLTLVTAFATGFLLLVKKPRAALFLSGSTITGAILSTALKDLVARPRPALVPHLAYVTTTSFPSGHSMVSATVYLTLGALMARFTPRLALKGYVMAFALFLTSIVGVSRVYAGVHWPSDVVAGWAAGTAWASACWIAAHAFQRRGAVERSPAPI